MPTAVFITASMNRPVLPCGPMLSLHGLAVIDWVMHRLSKAKLLDSVGVVTTKHPQDDVLAWHMENQGIEVFRGEGLEALIEAAERAGAESVVLIDGLSPLAWGPEVDALVRFHQGNGRCHACNHGGAESLLSGLMSGTGRQTLPACPPPLYAPGIGGEIFSAEFPGEVCRAGRVAAAPLTFAPADSRLNRPDKDLRLSTPEAYRRLALMPIHPDTPPAEALMRYPRQEG